MNKLGNRQKCPFEIFGFDIMFDEQMKPWILEVNAAPSLAADSPIDRDIKTNLVTDMLNLVGVRKNVLKRNNKP